MEFKIPKELEIKLKINGFNDSDIGDKIFKPKHVDEKLGDKLYFTDNYELSSTNLDKVDLKGDKVDFKNDVDKHRYILSSKSKMRDFMVKMQLGDKGEKGARYAEQSVKEAQKKFDEAKEKQSEEQLLEEQKNIKGKLQTAKQSKEGLEKEITNIKEKLEPSKEDKEKNIENVKEKREKEKEIAKLEEELEAATAGITKLKDLDETLTAAEKTKNGLKTGPADVKSRSEIVETNLKFILKTFFANKTNIKLSPNNFTIYSSDIGEGKLEDANSSDKKGSKKSQLIRLTTTFNIKIFEKKDKVGVLDMAKVGCKERAERIEKDVFELLGISVDLFQNSNVYNPVNILNKLREDSSKKDTIREERIRMAKEREIERREEKAVKKEAKAQAKEDERKLDRERKKKLGNEEEEEEEEEEDEDEEDEDSDDDETNYNNPEEVAKKVKRLSEDSKKEKRKRKKKGKEGKGTEKEDEPGDEDERGKGSGQKGGYKYRGKSPRKAKKTRRKTPKSKRKTRRKYR